MNLQQGQLDQLSDWLNQMESRIKSYTLIGSSEDEIRRQIEEIKVNAVGYQFLSMYNCTAIVWNITFCYGIAIVWDITFFHCTALVRDITFYHCTALVRDITFYHCTALVRDITFYHCRALVRDITFYHCRAVVRFM